MEIKLKRVYLPAAPGDGYRVLVDRLWPRGVKKEVARIDEWAKDLSPSNETRKHFHAKPEKWNEFRAEYLRELNSRVEELDALLGRVPDATLTLVYGSRDDRHNNAQVLAEALRERAGGEAG
jgi:uncharacterized protein YeaO (DUF488 family)